MVLTKEYRICMPLTTEEYRIGQLYMIARHSHEQSDSDEGVEVIQNTACEDPVHGKGQFTEKRIHLSSKLPYWIQSILPRIFYVTEKAWNYYPFTITEYTCSFIPKFHVVIHTRYEDNNGSTENCLGLSPINLIHREVDFVDIAYDEISAKHYKEEEDPKFFQSKRTGRGPLVEGWRDTTQPIMCSYKLVHASFEVWGMQTRVEDFIHRCIRDILLLGHRQAFAWIDEWYDMNLENVRQYEQKMQEETNEKVRLRNQLNEKQLSETGTPSPSMPTTPTAKSPTQSSNRSWFSWS
ncbi:PREDICTED: cytoplasmic phosphatidylinositol transfer protein 1 [Dinoponera quadriceps]|uniref:Cytoplasmic phosphatidylinositol transfer protein 1 n=1 Tax=Dinoponera quadriceps TaxID=609295 RepID=A0A6P3WUH2_DINQU|nr:PREDICTED: cytoplasmic phosphatidylinositol transfer protein 1 [Dinoponera quadriceps]